MLEESINTSDTGAGHCREVNTLIGFFLLGFSLVCPHQEGIFLIQVLCVCINTATNKYTRACAHTQNTHVRERANTHTHIHTLMHTYTAHITQMLAFFRTAQYRSYHTGYGIAIKAIMYDSQTDEYAQSISPGTGMSRA